MGAYEFCKEKKQTKLDDRYETYEHTQRFPVESRDNMKDFPFRFEKNFPFVFHDFLDSLT